MSTASRSAYTAEAASPPEGMVEIVAEREARALFAGLERATGAVLAVSGGPDSTALFWLAARWGQRRKSAPKLLAVTVDHGLRPGSAREALAVKRLAERLGVPHRTLRWRGTKPKTGIQEAARVARYRLLAEAAAHAGCSHIVTAHTLDDQAETVLFRLARGSGIAGLGAMQRLVPINGLLRPSRRGESRGEGAPTLRSTSPSESPHPSGQRPADLSPMGGGESGDARLFLFRPFLDIPKSRLLATLQRAGIDFADDPSNRDPRFTRARLREIMPGLAREGLDARRLALFARRAQRADAAIEVTVAAAAALVAPGVWPRRGPIDFNARHFGYLPDEVALRLLGRAIAHVGDEGPVELAKLEALHAALRRRGQKVRRTLAGALVTLAAGRLTVERAPPRRRPPVNSA